MERERSFYFLLLQQHQRRWKKLLFRPSDGGSRFPSFFYVLFFRYISAELIHANPYSVWFAGADLIRFSPLVVLFQVATFIATSLHWLYCILWYGWKHYCTWDKKSGICSSLLLLWRNGNLEEVREMYLRRDLISPSSFYGMVVVGLRL